jgi:hypothetical protein
MRPLYIFDLDGTLANMEHRVRFIRQPVCPNCEGESALPIVGGGCTVCDDTGLDESFKADWRSFFAACIDDAPIESAIRTMRALQNGGAETWIWTGRSDEVKSQTVAWLKQHGAYPNRAGLLHAPESLMMRRSGDHRPDFKLKYEWLSQLEPPEYQRLTAVFEDRASVVKMWRDAGVPCFQVAPGEF